MEGIPMNHSSRLDLIRCTTCSRHRVQLGSGETNLCQGEAVHILSQFSPPVRSLYLLGNVYPLHPQ